jgi:integrase
MLAETQIAPTTPEYLTKIETLSVVSPEFAIRRPLAELVENALTAAAGESENTARAYLTGIGLFLQYLSGHLADVLPPEFFPLAETSKVGRKTVWEFRGEAGVLRAVFAGLLDDFTAWRSDQGDSRSTQNLRRRAVSTFLRVCYRDGVLTHEQAQNMGLKPYTKREHRDIKPVGRRLKPNEVKKLRAIIDLKGKTESKTLRDKALIDVPLFSGLRRSEIASLNTGNFKQDGGRWWVVLQGKGKKTRRVKLHDALFKSITAWVEHLNDQDAGISLELGIDEIPIFYNLNKGGNLTGKPLNSGVIARIVSEYGAAAGLAPDHGENQLSPHDLRRTFARNARDNGAKLEAVQAALGHADVKTTMAYIGEQQDDNDTAIDYVRY